MHCIADLICLFPTSPKARLQTELLTTDADLVNVISDPINRLKVTINNTREHASHVHFTVQATNQELWHFKGEQVFNAALFFLNVWTKSRLLFVWYREARLLHRTDVFSVRLYDG